MMFLEVLLLRHLGFTSGGMSAVSFPGLFGFLQGCYRIFWVGIIHMIVRDLNLSITFLAVTLSVLA